MSAGLTVRQRGVLDFIREEAERGRSPTYREIGARFGLSSNSNVHRIIKCLEERGAIKALPGRARSIVLVAADQVCLTVRAREHLSNLKKQAPHLTDDRLVEIALGICVHLNVDCLKEGA